MTVRTRIAPSPTGDPHVGTAYIALFNYCFAKHHGGEFILRIEDTDQVRSTRESEEVILEALRWTGLKWDEGPDVGGPHGPYRQSERTELYKEHVQILLDKGLAFRCFCTPEELAASRAERQAAGEKFLGYDGRWANASEEEIQESLDAGKPYVIRMKVEPGETLVIKDRLRGDITFQSDEVDMQVLMKSDGLPTYHLANVVDDHHMGITHVMRGEEWISSAPKHLLLYRYFGWEMPELIHMPLLRNPDKSKLSKRKNPTSVLFYQRAGYLPQGLLNYLGLMGYSLPKKEGQAESEEVFTLQEMVETFDVDKISLGGPVFDREKLDHINGRWLREQIDEDTYAAAVVDWALNSEYMRPLIGMVKARVNKFSELPDWLSFIFSGPPTLTVDDLLNKQVDTPEKLTEVLQFVLWRIEDARPWTAENISSALKDVAKICDIKFGMLMKVVFPVMTGKTNGPPMFDSMAHMGIDMTRARFRAQLEMVGAPGKKKLKKLEKAYRAGLAALVEPAEQV